MTGTHVWVNINLSDDPEHENLSEATFQPRGAPKKYAGQ